MASGDSWASWQRSSLRFGSVARSSVPGTANCRSFQMLLIASVTVRLMLALAAKAPKVFPHAASHDTVKHITNEGVRFCSKSLRLLRSE